MHVSLFTEVKKIASADRSHVTVSMHTCTEQILA